MKKSKVGKKTTNKENLTTNDTLIYTNDVCKIQFKLRYLETRFFKTKNQN